MALWTDTGDGRWVVPEQDGELGLFEEERFTLTASGPHVGESYYFQGGDTGGFLPYTYQRLRPWPTAGLEFGFPH